MAVNRYVPQTLFCDEKKRSIDLGALYALSLRTANSSLVPAKRSRNALVPRSKVTELEPLAPVLAGMFNALSIDAKPIRRTGVYKNLPAELAAQFSISGARHRIARPLPAAKQAKVVISKGSISRRQKTADLVDIGTQTIEMPPWESKLVSVGYVKALVGRPNDTMLRQANGAWEIALDDDLINLTDSSKVYRLGAVEIYS